MHPGHRHPPGHQHTCLSILSHAVPPTALGTRGPQSRLPQHGQCRVKLSSLRSLGQGIFGWISHWNLKSMATRKHLFSCPSMIKQVALRHKKAEFPLAELFSFCCKISNILTFPSDFSLYQSFNGRIISRLLDFTGFYISEHSLLYKGTLLKVHVIPFSKTKEKVIETRVCEGSRKRLRGFSTGLLVSPSPCHSLLPTSLPPSFPPPCLLFDSLDSFPCLFINVFSSSFCICFL